MVAWELLRCRLMESAATHLLERIAELLDAVARGTPPFCSLLTSQVVARSHGGPRRARVLPGAPGGLASASSTSGAGHPAAPLTPLGGVATGIAPHGPNGAPPYSHQGGAPGSAAWGIGRLDGCSGEAAQEAYVPRMVDQEYMAEDDPCSFLEPGWEEEMLEVEAFHEPPRSLADPANDNNHKIPLISQEQAYANHGSQVDQVTAVDGDPSAATSLQQGKHTGGYAVGAWSKAPLRVARSKVSPGGRSSVGEAPASLFPGRGPMVAEGAARVPFAPWHRPSFRTPQRWSRAAQGGALFWRYEARPAPVKVSARDTLT